MKLIEEDAPGAILPQAIPEDLCTVTYAKALCCCLHCLEKQLSVVSCSTKQLQERQSETQKSFCMHYLSKITSVFVIAGYALARGSFFKAGKNGESY